MKAAPKGFLWELLFYAVIALDFNCPSGGFGNVGVKLIAVKDGFTVYDDALDAEGAGLVRLGIFELFLAENGEVGKKACLDIAPAADSPQLPVTKEQMP